MKKIMPGLFAALILCASLSIPAKAEAGEVRVAVASNFTPVAKDLAARFESETGHKVILSFGSTGKLYTQIIHGAPFDVFLAADGVRPERLITEGLALSESLHTYAIGTLVLWSPKPNLITPDLSVLKQGRFSRVAIANPKTAPYGAAAEEVLAGLNILDQTRPKLVRGDNIAQTFQFVMTGNVDMAFIAGSQASQQAHGSRWIIPADLYSSLTQKAVLLNKAEDKETAEAFLAFLRLDKSKALIETYGYWTD